MYRTIRAIHLLAGAATFPFLLLYGISAVQMAHPRLFRSKPVVETVSRRLAPGSEAPRELATRLLEAGVVRGEILEASANAGTLELRIARPGTVHKIRYATATGETTIRTERSAPIFVLNRLHHIAGIEYEFAPLNAWGAVLGVVAALLLVLGASGIYLWFRIHSERRAGVMLLAANLLGSGLLIALLRGA